MNPRRILARLAGVLPVSRRRHVAALRNQQHRWEATLKDHRRERQRAVERARECANRIVARGTSLRWLKDGTRYCVVVSFDPAMLGYGCMPAAEQEELADHVAWHVRAAVASAKFVHEPDKCGGRIDAGRPAGPKPTPNPIGQR